MLLVEYTLLDNLQVINENTAGGKTKTKLRGRFQKCDEQNNNGRIYPRKILEGQVKKIQEKIGDRSLVGALDHPANDAIHLSQASHLITGLSVDKSGDVIGECEILSTPNGKIVQSLINDGVKIGISSRGVGSVSEGAEGKIVNEDFKLITFDLVSDPSTKGAFPGICESMRENSQRAQAIVSKHKKDRVLMTMLESKVNEKLNEGKFKDKDVMRQEAALKFGEKVVNPGAMKGSRVKRRRANKSNLKGMTTNQVIKTPVFTPKPDNKTDNTTAATQLGKMRINKETGKIRSPKNGPVTMKPKKRHSNVKLKASTNIIGNALIEGFKKVCWGDRYDEVGEVKKRNKQKKREFEADQQRQTVAHNQSTGGKPLMPTRRMQKAGVKGGEKAANVAGHRQARQGIDDTIANTNDKVTKFRRMTQKQISNLHPKDGNERARLIRMGRIPAANPKKK